MKLTGKEKRFLRKYLPHVFSENETKDILKAFGIPSVNEYVFLFLFFVFAIAICVDFCYVKNPLHYILYSVEFILFLSAGIYFFTHFFIGPKASYQKHRIKIQDIITLGGVPFANIFYTDENDIRHKEDQILSLSYECQDGFFLQSKDYRIILPNLKATNPYYLQESVLSKLLIKHPELCIYGKSLSDTQEQDMQMLHLSDGKLVTGKDQKPFLANTNPFHIFSIQKNGKPLKFYQMRKNLCPYV